MCDAPGAFPVFWNQDLGGARPPIDVTRFGILRANWTCVRNGTSSQYSGCEMWNQTLQDLLPTLPQLGNLTDYVVKLRVAVSLWIIDPDWTGLAPLHLDGVWNPYWEQNYEHHKGLSRQLVEKRHPTWDFARNEAQAKWEFEQAATMWLVRTLEVCHQVRPLAKWGLVGLSASGERAMPILLASQALYPSLYNNLTCSADKLAQLNHSVTAAVTQAVALSQAVFAQQAGRARAPPVYPFVSDLCRGDTLPMLNADAMRTILFSPYAAGASGIVLWLASRDRMAAQDLNWTAYWGHMTAVTGPLAAAVSSEAESCAVNRCSGNGRCSQLPSVAGAHGSVVCVCDNPWGGENCALHRCVSTAGVALASCYGYDTIDATDALQLALSDPAASTVVVDRPINADHWTVRPTFVWRNNVRVEFEDGVLLQARSGYFQGVQDSLLTLFLNRNVSLVGHGNATLRMQRAEYTNKTMGYLLHSESRTGIQINRASQVKISGLRVEETGGDGVAVDGYSDISLSDMILHRNFRQGLTVGNATNLLIERVTFSNTGDEGLGTPPMAGLYSHHSHYSHPLINKYRTHDNDMLSLRSGHGAGYTLPNAEQRHFY